MKRISKTQKLENIIKNLIEKIPEYRISCPPSVSEMKKETCAFINKNEYCTNCWFDYIVNNDKELHYSNAKSIPSGLEAFARETYILGNYPAENFDI